MASKMREKRAPHPIVALQEQINEIIGHRLPPGPAFLPHYWIINLQKGGTLPFILGLMWYYDHWSAQAYFYAAAHGSYGFIWLLKHFVIPDNKWAAKTTVVSQIASFVLVLGPYWLAPYLLISGAAPLPSVGRCCAALVVYVVGVVAMCVADCYKAVELRYRKGLITTGPFAHIRHPNYTGEMMIYGAFAAMVPHWAPMAVLAWVWGQLFLPNMLIKEASMSRYGKDWDDYYARTGMLLPPLSALFGSSKKD